MNERAEQLSKGGFSAKDLDKATLPELVEAWNAAAGSVKARIRRYVMENVAKSTILFYPGYRSGFPYQDEPSDRRSITVFRSEDEAEEYIWNLQMEEEEGSGSNPYSAFVRLLGFNGKVMTKVMEQLAFYGIDEIRIPGDPESGTVFTCSYEDLCLVFDPDSRPSAPGTRKNIGRMEEGMYRNATADELSAYQEEAYRAAANETFYLPLKDDELLLYEGYIEIYTDPVELSNTLDNAEYDRAETVTWNRIAGYGKGVGINRYLQINPDVVLEINNITGPALEAYNAICAYYGLDWELESDRKTADRIYADIQDAPPVMQELLDSLTTTPTEGNGDDVVITCAPPEENAVEVNWVNEQGEANAVTAPNLVNSGLCTDPLRAYHVLALLYNDPSGENRKAFDNAELFE